MLRRGNHPSAKVWRRVLLPVIECNRDRDIPKYFRGDAVFALPKLLLLLENEGFRYAIRLKGNPMLERKIAHLLNRAQAAMGRLPVALIGGKSLQWFVRAHTLTLCSRSRGYS